MRTVNYSDVLQGTLALAGIPLAGFDPASPEFALVRTCHDRRLRVAWEAHSWPDICRYEQRAFRPPWNATTAYAAGTELLDIPTLSYVQALQPSTGQAPTTNGVVNQTYWAPCQTQYQANSYLTGTIYPVGSQVLNPADNLYYQLYNAGMVVAGGAGVGNYLPAAVVNGRLSYATGAQTIQWTGTRWEIQYPSNFPHGLASNSNVVSPDLATGWFALGDDTAAGLTVTAATSNAVSAPPGNGWGRITPFQRYVAYQQYDQNGQALTPLGEVFRAWDRDPRVTTKTCPTPFTVTSDGFAFTTLRHVPAFVWLYYRLQRPTLTGDLFDATLIYTSGRQVYFVSPTTGTGDFYNCTATTTAGQSPATTPASWSVVALPYAFREYLVQGGYADWLTSDGQADKAQAIEGVAAQLLEMEADKLQRQQQQTNRLDWRY